MPDRDDEGKFIDGNNAAEKWSEDKVREKLQKVYQYYIEHEDIVTPNKLAEHLEREGVLKVSQFRYLLEQKDYPFSHSVKNNIDYIEEGRVMEANMPAGIIAMVLKNKFDYSDKQEIEESGSKSINYRIEYADQED